MQKLARELPSELRAAAKTAERKFSQRSKFQKARSVIYDDYVSLSQRFLSFRNILLSGGYLPDPSRTRLGPRAAMKDILFGVPGIYRIRI